MGVTRRPLLWSALPDKGLWRRGMEIEALLAQHIGRYVSSDHSVSPRGLEALASVPSAHAKRMPGPSTQTNTTATIAAAAIHPQPRAMGIGSSPVGAKSGSK